MGNQVTFERIEIETIKKTKHELRSVRVHCAKNLIDIILCHVNLSPRHYHLEYLRRTSTSPRPSPVPSPADLAPNPITTTTSPRSSSSSSPPAPIPDTLTTTSPSSLSAPSSPSKGILEEYVTLYPDTLLQTLPKDFLPVRIRLYALGAPEGEEAPHELLQRRRSKKRGSSRGGVGAQVGGFLRGIGILGSGSQSEEEDGLQKALEHVRKSKEDVMGSSGDGTDDISSGGAGGGNPRVPPKVRASPVQVRNTNTRKSPTKSGGGGFFASVSRGNDMHSYLMRAVPGFDEDDEPTQSGTSSKAKATTSSSGGGISSAGEDLGDEDEELDLASPESAEWRTRLRPTYTRDLPGVSSSNVTLVYSSRNARLPTVLGNGTYGIVYLGQFMNRKVAVKVLPMEDPEEDLPLVQQEVQIMMENEHPNILKCFGMFTDKNELDQVQAYVVLELATGGDLYDAIHSRNGLLKNASDEELLRVMIDIALGVQFLHKRKIIHRDLKSNNILLSWNTWKLCDFGSSKLSTSMRGQTIHGTPEYLAPEILDVFTRKHQDYSHLVDIYSLGVLFWEIWTRRKVLAPYYDKYGAQIARDPMKFVAFLHRNEVRPPLTEKYMRPECPPELADLIGLCWKTEPRDRPQSVEEIVNTLNGLLSRHTANVKKIFFGEDGDRLYYVGEFVHSEKHGIGKEYYLSGGLKFEGEFYYDEFQKGKFYDEEANYVQYDGEFFEGRFHGTGRLFDARGSLLYDGLWGNGERHGAGKEFYPLIAPVGSDEDAVLVRSSGARGRPADDTFVTAVEPEKDIQIVDVVEVSEEETDSADELEGERDEAEAVHQKRRSSPFESPEPEMVVLSARLPGEGPNGEAPKLRFEGVFRNGKFRQGKYYSRDGQVLFDGKFRFRDANYLFMGSRFSPEEGGQRENVPVYHRVDLH